MSETEKEKQALQHSVEVSRIMADVLEHHERENKRLWRALIVSLVCNVIIAACMIWTVQNFQTVANNAMANALEAVAEIGVTTDESTTTTTTEVTQDTGEGSGNNVYQAGENSTYNEAGGAE